MDFLGGVWELALHRELMEIHIQTLFEMDESGALLRENEVDGRRGPILYMGRTCLGDIVTAFGIGCPGGLKELLQDLTRMESARDPIPAYPCNFPRVIEEVDRQCTVSQVSAGPVFLVRDFLKTDTRCEVITTSDVERLDCAFGHLVAEISVIQPCVVLVVEGEPVSACWSARRSSQGAEAGVETHGQFRGDGVCSFGCCLVGDLGTRRGTDSSL